MSGNVGALKRGRPVSSFTNIIDGKQGLNDGRPLRMAEGMHFSVVCAEDQAIPGHAASAPGADFGNAFAELYQRTCAYWPRGTVPAAFLDAETLTWGRLSPFWT